MCTSRPFLHAAPAPPFHDSALACAIELVTTTKSSSSCSRLACTSIEMAGAESAGARCCAGVPPAATAGNVIPAHSVLKGTLRTFTPEQTDTALARLEALTLELTSETGCTFAVHFDDTAPAVRNDAGVSDLVRGAAARVVGEAGVFAMPPVTPSDDVSLFLERIPGCYFFVGAARADGTSGMHHNPGFAIDEACLSIAARVLAGSAIACALPA